MSRGFLTFLQEQAEDQREAEEEAKKEKQFFTANQVNSFIKDNLTKLLKDLIYIKKKQPKNNQYAYTFQELIAMMPHKQNDSIMAERLILQIVLEQLQQGNNK